MKVRPLNIDLSLRFGGATVRALSNLKHLECDAAGLAALRGGQALEQARREQVTSHVVGRSRADPTNARRIARVIRDHGYNLIDTHNIQAKLWGHFAARATGVAFVSTLNSWYQQEFAGRLRGFVYQRLDSATNRGVDVFIAVSEEIEEKLLAAGADHDRVVLMPSAVDIDAGSIGGCRRTVFESARIPTSATLCCSVGRLVEAKGYPYLIGAAAELVRRHENLYFAVIGSGRQRRELQRLIDLHGIGERFKLLGGRARAEVLEIMKACDVFVLPSTSEGTPVALLEAAALGKPIVASRVGGVPQVITDGIHGRLCRPADPASLVRAIDDVLSNPERSRGMAEKARRRAASRFGLSAQIAATLSAYERALELARARMR